MVYFTRNKKFYEGPKGDAGNEPPKQNPIADKPSVLQPNKSNLSKEDKTKITDQKETTTIIKKNSTQLENINYNLDVFAQNIEECERKFNQFSILLIDIGNTFTCFKSKNEYRAVCKVGYGGSSVVWLVIDTKKKEFKIAKVFKYGHFVSNFEKNIHNQTSNHPNILRFYEDFVVDSWYGRGHVAIYEPLGKDLYSLMKEASKGLSISIVKKVAKHVLLALKTIHDLKVIHTDIKLQNIAPCVSQLSLRQEFEKIVKSGNSLSSLRMVCERNTELDEIQKRMLFKEELDKLPKQDIQELTQLIFKLIDFGNAMKEGTKSTTGTYGFRPPEYFYGAPLLPSHDIWSLGITIVVLLTNKMFLESGKSKKIDELKKLRNMFGKFSRHHFKGFKGPGGYKTKYSTRFYTCSMAKKQLKKVLRNKFDRLQMGENDRNGLINFLLPMLNIIPTKRKSAAELLLHPWLNAPEVQKETNINAFVIPVACNDTSSPSNCNDVKTSEILLDDLSINEQIGNANSVKFLPSNDPKHSKNGGDATRKTKLAPMIIIRYDSFIYIENGKNYLFHKYWRISYEEKKKCFVCPGCKGHISFGRPGSPPEIGFVMVSTVDWHKDRRCKVSHKESPPMKRRGRNKYTKEEIDSKRNLLLEQGYKPFEEPEPKQGSDAIDQKEANNSEVDDYDYDGDSEETEYGTDSDLDETEDDSNKTISEFGSGESYVELDTSYDSHVDSSDDEEIDIAEWSNV